MRAEDAPTRRGRRHDARRTRSRRRPCPTVLEGSPSGRRGQVGQRPWSRRRRHYGVAHPRRPMISSRSGSDQGFWPCAPGRRPHLAPGGGRSGTEVPGRRVTCRRVRRAAARRPRPARPAEASPPSTTRPRRGTVADRLRPLARLSRGARARPAEGAARAGAAGADPRPVSPCRPRLEPPLPSTTRSRTRSGTPPPAPAAPATPFPPAAGAGAPAAAGPVPPPARRAGHRIATASGTGRGGPAPAGGGHGPPVRPGPRSRPPRRPAHRRLPPPGHGPPGGDGRGPM